MRLILIFHGRFPSEKAAALFVAKSALAFSKKGLEVIVIVPKRRGLGKVDPFTFYSVEKSFEIKYLPTIDLFGILPDKLAFWISLIAFSISTFFYTLMSTDKSDIIYSNEIVTLTFTAFIRSNCFYEMHDFPESKLNIFNYALQRMRWILIHNKWKLEEVCKKFDTIDKIKFIYETNAVDINAFDLNISIHDARVRLGLPLDKRIIVYTGHLYGWKGVDTLAKSMSKLPDQYLSIFVGGTEKDIKEFRERYSKNILIVGYKRHIEIPLWQKAADILALPNTAREAISAYYTSPMKLYEYMASKRLVVASDIPSIREIVDEKSVIFAKPDDEISLAEKIVEAISIDSSKYSSYTDNAFELVLEHTWEKRAERIINFIKKND